MNSNKKYVVTYADNNYSANVTFGIQSYPFNGTILVRGLVYDSENPNKTYPRQQCDYTISIDENKILSIPNTQHCSEINYSSINFSIVENDLIVNISPLADNQKHIAWIIIMN